MSHVASIDVKFKDLDILESICDELGLELVRGQKNYKWYGQWVDDYHGEDAAFKHGVKTEDYGKCDHAIRVKGDSNAYEIGLVETDDGYQPIYDFYGGGGGLMNKISQDGGRGKDCGKLTQRYAEEVATKKARGLGYIVHKTVDDDGNIQLRATR